MKTWIKILVAVCVVVIVSISVWAIFFREKDEVQAYSKTAELIDYKQSLAINDKLNELKTLNYCKGDVSKTISGASNAGEEILEIRRIVLSDGLVLGYGDNQFYSYLVMEEYLDEILEYYLPYTKGDRVKTKSLNAVKESVKDYIRSLKKLDEKIDSVIEYQNAIEGSSVELEILRGYYQQFREQFRTSLSYGSTVLDAVINYIDASVYSDDLIVDTKTALYDSYTRALHTAVTVEVKLEPDYANDVRIIINRINDVEKGRSIFKNQNEEYSFLQSYNNLFNHYDDTLDYIFECKNLEKGQMAVGMSLGNVLEKAQQPVIQVLKVLGF